MASTEHTEVSLPTRDPVSGYQKLKRIGEGTYGVSESLKLLDWYSMYYYADKARDKSTGRIVALKKILTGRKNSGIPVTAIRELRVLQTCKHPNIVQLLKVVTGSKFDSIFLVFEYCAHDLGRLLDSMSRPFSEAAVKCLMKQLLTAVEWIHAQWIIHRDLKMCNLLLTGNGCLKLCDFGLARYSQAYEQPCTPNVVTLWYRAPELLLGLETYTEKVDMWAVGCIMGELLKHAPVFPGRSEIQMLELFTKLLGNPHTGIWPDFKQLPHAQMLNIKEQPYNYTEQEFPNVTPAALNLLNQLLTYDPKKRSSARKALSHPWFRQHPLPLHAQDMPKFPSTQDAHSSAAARPVAEKADHKQQVDARFGLVFAGDGDHRAKRRRLP